MNPPDAELLRRHVEESDEAAFAELVRRHIDLVYRVALRKAGDPHAAEEITQVVFTALARKAPALAHHQAIVGWLHTATRFAANEVRRAERRRRRWETEAGTMLEHPTDPAEHLAWDEIRPVIDDVLGELRASDREAVLLRFFSNLPFAAIGATLNLSENAARMRVERALDTLRGLLARRGINSSAAALTAAISAQAHAGAAPAALAATVTSAALAGAAPATAISATLVMSASKLQIGAAVVVALLLGAAIHHARLTRQLEARTALARTARTAMQDEQTRLAAALAAAQAERSRLDAQRVAPRPTPAAAAGTEATPPSQLEIIRDNYLHRRAVARSDPEYQRLQARQRWLEIRQSYGPLFHRLRWSAGHVEAFQRIMADYELALFDIQSAADATRVASSDAALDPLKAAARQTMTDKLRTLLDAESFAAFQQYDQTTMLRAAVTNPVAVALAETPTPLAPAQADALTEILARHARADADGRKDASGLDWNAALAEAGTHLTPDQIAALEAVQRQRQWSDTLASALSPLVFARLSGK